MGTFRILDVINGLHTVWSAAPALEGVRVVKSWEIIPAGDKEHLYIAGDGGASFGAEEVAESTIEWAGLGPNAREESGTVDCAASVWTGDQAAVTATIDRAFAIVGACEDMLRTFPELHSDIALLAKITDARLRTVQAGQGYRVIVPFVVSFQTSV
jgi:hypothetical protein